MVNLFSPKPLEKILLDDLYDAERECLIAASQSEHWASMHAMLQGRVERLRQEVEMTKQRKE